MGSLWILSLFLAGLRLCFGSVFHGKSVVFYADNGHEKTMPFPLYRNRERLEFQEKILQLLGLERAPRPRHVTKDDTVPHYMLDLYRNILAAEKDDDDEEEMAISPAYKYLDSAQTTNTSGRVSALFDYAKADTIMSFITKDHQVVSDHGHMAHLNFDVSDVKEDFELIGAELRMFTNESTQLMSQLPKGSTIEIYILNRDRDTLSSAEDSNFRRVVSGKLPDNTIGWIVLNVTEALQLWMANPIENSGLFAEIIEPSGVAHSPRDFGLLEHSFMVGFFNAGNEQAHRRVKRSTTEQSSGPNYGQKYSAHDPWYSIAGTEVMARRACQKRTLYVSFKDLGWQEWVIAPDGYAAYYCDGKCSFPLQAHMNATNHAIVQTLVYLMDPARVPEPQCAPTKLHSMKVLYFDHTSNVVLKTYRNMVVKACGCH